MLRKTNRIPRRRPALLLATAFLTFAPAAGAQTGGPSGPAPISVEKALPGYRIPREAEIIDALGKVREQCGRFTDPRVYDRKTKQPITDFSVPSPDAATRLGGYPVGVIHNGMLLAGEVTGDARFSGYTRSALQLLADRGPYFKAQAEKFGVNGNSLRGFIAPFNLDSCGAWGAAMVKARRAGVGPDIQPTIDLFADYVSHKQFRLKDGTLARRDPQPDAVWADDLYMSVPFLAQMGKLTGERRYYDDAARQVLQIAKRLFSQRNGIYAHGWSAGTADYNPEFYWGRANGWCLMATVELLEVLPEDHPRRGAVLQLLRTQVKALAALQSPSGLWHQLLDKPDSYLETSCTAMFTFGIARAVNRGWVSAAGYGPVALAGWNGLAACINPEGRIEGTCIGTNFASDAAYYYRRPRTDDIHSYGPVLLAGAETIRLLNNTALHIRKSTTNTIYPVSVITREDEKRP